MRHWMGLALVAVACAGDSEKSTVVDDSGIATVDTASDSGMEAESAEPVLATARLLDPLSSAGLPGLNVADVDGGATCTTDADGQCGLEVASSAAVQLAVTGDGVLEHRLFGLTGTDDFTTISFVATPNLTRQIYGLLEVSADPSAGTVVVGLDRPNLSPATGASATIDASSEIAFVLGARLPEEGTTLVEGGSPCGDACGSGTARWRARYDAPCSRPNHSAKRPAPRPGRC